jgi:hypothetical protein
MPPTVSFPISELIRHSDKFILYDDAKFMKGKYINRNFFPDLFTFRLKKHSDYAKINELRWFDIEDDKQKFRRKFHLSVDQYLDLLHQDEPVIEGIFKTVQAICKTLGFTRPIYLSSQIPHGKFADGIVDMVRTLEGDRYINLPGGKALYTQSMFGDISLGFVETTPEPSILCFI